MWGCSRVRRDSLRARREPVRCPAPRPGRRRASGRAALSHGIQSVARPGVARAVARFVRSPHDTRDARMTRIDNARRIRAPRGQRDHGQELADRSAAAHAHEQPRRPRWPRSPRSSSSTAASAAPRATGRASTASSRRCARSSDDETLLVQSGKPVGVFRTHADAPRVLIANSNLVPHWATLGALPRARPQGPDDVRPDDGRLVDLHRQPGHRAGHLRDVRRGRAGSTTAATCRAGGS